MDRFKLIGGLIAGLALVGCVVANTNVGGVTMNTSVGGVAVGQVPGAPNTAAVSPAAPASPAASGAVKPAASPGANPSTMPSPVASATRGPRPVDSAPPGGTIADQSRFAGKEVKPSHRIAVETTQGTFVVTLFPEQAPKAVAKFMALVGGGVYDGTTFHRVIPGFVAQGGDPLSKTLPAGDPRIGTGDYGEGVPDDFKNGLGHMPGAVAFAHSGAPSSSNCQFYVCLTRLGSLDDGYIVFGQVVGGFDSVLKLNATNKAGATPDKILKAVIDE